MFSSSEIPSLYQELLKQQSAFKEKDALLLKREKIVEHLENLRNDNQKNILRVYRETGHLEDLKIKEIKKRDALLAQKLLEMDAVLDLLEDVTEETLSKMQNALIEKILATFPEEKSSYFNWHKKMDHNLKVETQLIEKLHFFNRLIRLLEGIQQTRLTLKQRGLLSYIFGINPNQALSRYMQGIIKIIEEDTLFLQEEEIDLFKIELKKNCQGRWNFKLLDASINKKLHQAINFKERHQEQFNKNEATRQALESELAIWLDKNSNRHLA